MKHLSVVAVVALCWASLVVASAQAVDGSDARTLDWSAKEIQETSASCGAFTFTGMADGKAYALWVRGTTSGTCSFKADGLTFHFPPNYGPTSAETSTLFSFLRSGDNVLVTWVAGY